MWMSLTSHLSVKLNDDSSSGIAIVAEPSENVTSLNLPLWFCIPKLRDMGWVSSKRALLRASRELEILSQLVKCSIP